MDNTQQSRDLGMGTMNMQQHPMQYNWESNMAIKPQYQDQPLLQQIPNPVPPRDLYHESIFKNSKQETAIPFSSKTEHFVVVKTMKRQRQAYRQASIESEATMSEGSEAPKRRKPDGAGLGLPTSGKTVSAPHTPPGDLTPQLQATTTTEMPTPDASFDLKHRRIGSRLSQLIPQSFSPPSRINEIDLFKVVMRDQNPPYHQSDPQHTEPEQPESKQPEPSLDYSVKAQSYIELAHAHMKVQDFHSAETDFLGAFHMYNRSRGSQSPEVIRTMGEMAGLYEDQERPAEAPRRRRNCYVFCG